jgi:hypothetical protein
MKKLLFSLLIGGSFFSTLSAYAQFRSIPGIVTDSFKVRYPGAKSVNWEDKVSSFQATFMVDTSKYVAHYTSKGEWQGAQKKIAFSSLPVEVTDGLAKSKYADWPVNTVTQRYLPGDVVQYSILVVKSSLSKKTLLFSSKGQLLKDSSTL